MRIVINKEETVLHALGHHTWVCPFLKRDQEWPRAWYESEVSPEKYVFKVCKVCRRVEYVANPTWKVPPDSVKCMEEAAQYLYGEVKL